MSAVPTVLDEVRWTFPNGLEGKAWSFYGTAELREALESAGATVTVRVAETPTEHTNPRRFADPNAGHIGYRYFPHDTGRDASYPEDPEDRGHLFSNGNGTEFS